MSFLFSNDSIIACSTGGSTNTAIAIIRVSGTDILPKVSQFLSINSELIKPRYAHFCSIIFNGHVYDEVVLTYFKGPNSYNGEDIIELSVHGNVLNIDRIINLIISNSDIRYARPGEFSLRALHNKKLTLNQVEGLDLLLNANSVFALDQGFSLLSGKMQKDFSTLYDLYMDLRSSLELGFDFLEDIGEEQFNQRLQSSHKNLFKHIKRLFAHVSNNSDLLLSPEISIVGLPNAGKSSFFNFFLDDDRAIVSDIAGTTRDYISEKIAIKDVLFSLIDTAGVRDTSDMIESRGVDKALEIASSSFFKILLVNPFDDNAHYYAKLDQIAFDMVVFTHSDLCGFDKAKSAFIIKYTGVLTANFGSIEPTKSVPIEPTKSGPIEPIKSGPIEPTKSGPIEPTRSGPIEPIKPGSIEPTKSGPIEPVSISLLNCSTIEKEEILSNIYAKYLKLLSFDPIIVKRQSDLVGELHAKFADYDIMFNDEFDDISIIASELNIVGHCISELIGIVSPDDVLHNIFDNFCIGK